MTGVGAACDAPTAIDLYMIFLIDFFFPQRNLIGVGVACDAPTAIDLYMIFLIDFFYFLQKPDWSWSGL